MLAKISIISYIYIYVIILEIEDKPFSSEIKHEKTSSMDQSNQQSNSKKNEIQSSIDEPIMNISEQYDERVQNPLHNTNIKK